MAIQRNSKILNSEGWKWASLLFLCQNTSLSVAFLIQYLKKKKIEENIDLY